MRVFFALFFISLSIQLIAQSAKNQSALKSNNFLLKDSAQRILIKQTMDTIFWRDQKYRGLTGNPLLNNDRFMDSIQKAMSPSDFNDFITKLDSQVDQKKDDSLMKLQEPLDELNKINFIALVKKHGYPNPNLFYGNKSTNERSAYNSYLIAIILHLLGENDFKELKPLFYKEVKGKRMPPKHYAIWYDRNLFVYGKSKEKKLLG